MTQHKYADLLRYAADNADAKFMSETYNERYGNGDNIEEIYVVLRHDDYDDWQIYKEPVTETVWYWQDDKGAIWPFVDKPELVKWFMKITYVDGKPTKAEFADGN